METSLYSEYGLFTGDMIFANVPTKEPVIEGLIYERDVICISAQAGIGKSILAIQLASTLTSGRDFLDTYKVSKPYTVLYIQTEGDRTETVERLLRMGKGLPLDTSKFYHFNAPGLQINDFHKMNEFMRDIKIDEINYEIVIIDPLYTTVKGTLVSDDTATDWFRNIRRMRIRCPNATFIILHHDGKDLILDGKKVERSTMDIFGSNFWSAIFSNNYKLRIHNGIYTLDLGKGRSGPDKIASKIDMKLLQPTPLMYIVDDSNVNETTAAVEAVLKKDKDKSYSRIDLENIVQKSKPTIWRALKVLDDHKKLEHSRIDGIPYYQWKEQECNKI